MLNGLLWTRRDNSMPAIVVDAVLYSLDPGIAIHGAVQTCVKVYFLNAEKRFDRPPPHRATFDRHSHRIWEMMPCRQSSRT